MPDVRVKVYRAHRNYYIGVNPLEISYLPPGTTFTIVCPPNGDSQLEHEHYWRRQRWQVTIYPMPDNPTAFVLEEEVALTADEAAYFQALE